MKKINEITFIVEEAPEGGYTAHALGQSVYTEAENISDLHNQVRDAVNCHFEKNERPEKIRLQFVREEVIAA
ncbi:hypothetical protein [Desulfonema magnum]|uniref:2-oxoisovalerate dehydrogenase n=1 Tax=Desulfonema magnum TaxID=45655 RepID=A0A975BMB1_9BACT|nr:hypothetical protein [Desulfonema magnum]QTA87640.1 Uncharacterized protein dnm_036740 [Desulfonema magnum]